MEEALVLVDYKMTIIGHHDVNFKQNIIKSTRLLLIVLSNESC
jgi:hypothetical protein